jgi:phosphoribosylamine--glycine ligase
VLPLLESDLYQGLVAIMESQDPNFVWSDEHMIGTVLATKGYPGDYETGALIEGLESLDQDTFVFHCGTAKTSDGFVTAGGRVLLIARKDKTFQKGKDKLYQEISKIKCEDLFYRKDIGGRSCQH